MGVKVRCNDLSPLLFYTYFLAAWVSNLSFPWFFCQRFPFTDVTKFCFASAVSPGSILSTVRRNHKKEVKSRENPNPTGILTTLRKNPSLFAWLRLSTLFLALMLFPKLPNREHNKDSEGHISSELWEWGLPVLKVQWLMRARRKHTVPLYWHQHSIYYVHITRWQ